MNMMDKIIEGISAVVKSNNQSMMESRLIKTRLVIVKSPTQIRDRYHRYGTTKTERGTK